MLKPLADFLPVLLPLILLIASLFLLHPVLLLLLLFMSMFAALRMMGTTPANHSNDVNGGRAECKLPFAFSLTQGRRPYMEDEHLEEVPLGSIADSAIFGVFDGHSGKKAAQYARDNIPRHLTSLLSSYSSSSSSSESVMEAMKRAFLSTDAEFCEKAEAEYLDDGSTAIVALLIGKKLWVANAGDARCVLGHRGDAVAMSEDHKPNRESEKRRIQAAGGKVLFLGCWRVDGVLATSRGFGDKELKKYVTAEPEIQPRTLIPGDEFLILASDGLWDVLSNQDAVDIVTKADNIRTASKSLTEEALRRGSLDNITALVVDLRGVAGGSEASGRGGGLKDSPIAASSSASSSTSSKSLFSPASRLSSSSSRDLSSEKDRDRGGGGLFSPGSAAAASASPAAKSALKGRFNSMSLSSPSSAASSPGAAAFGGGGGEREKEKSSASSLAARLSSERGTSSTSGSKSLSSPASKSSSSSSSAAAARLSSTKSRFSK